MVIKVDRNLLHRLIVAYEAGREVDLQGLLKHKLMPVPVSIAEMNGVLRTTSKPVLGDVLISGITCYSSIRPEGSLLHYCRCTSSTSQCNWKTSSQ